jgi:hypothetical protein
MAVPFKQPAKELGRRASAMRGDAMVLTGQTALADITDLEDAFWVLDAWIAEFCYLNASEAPQAVTAVVEFLWRELGSEEFEARTQEAANG